MKATERVLDARSTLQGEEIRLSIDLQSMPHLMSVLTDLYSDPELAVVREYSTNALDAHVEAGVSRPIEVSLPTALSPFLRIRDYGAGLDSEDIREIYSKYGASTKRDTDDAVGMLGLGCKSALTYTDQFTLVGIKDGVMTQVSVSRDETGAGTMTVVHEGPTDDPSGVEVIVPAKRVNEFERKAQEFFRFWAPGSVLVNGKPPKRIDGVWVADDLLLTKEVEQNMVVMGNVAYPLEENQTLSPFYYNRANGGYATVAFVPIGSVNFVPSREALAETKATKDTRATIKARVEREKYPALTKYIESASTKAEAMKRAREAQSIGLNRQNCTWRGQVVPVRFTNGPYTVVHGVKRWGDKDCKPVAEIDSSNDIRWVLNFPVDAKDFTKVKRLKLEAWQEQEEVETPQYWIMVRSNSLHPSDAPWIDNERVHDWNDIDAMVVTQRKAPRRDGRPSGSYDGYVGGVRTSVIKAEDIDTSKPLFYYIGYRYSVPSGAFLMDSPNTTVVRLPSNRVEKFQRDFPMAREINQACREVAQAWLKTVSEGTLEAYAAQSTTEGSFASELDASRIDDPELARYIRVAKQDLTSFKNQVRMYSKWVAIPRKEIANPFTDKYPLVSFLRYLPPGQHNHLYLYLNAAYAAGKEG